MNTNAQVNLHLNPKEDGAVLTVVADELPRAGCWVARVRAENAETVVYGTNAQIRRALARLVQTAGDELARLEAEEAVGRHCGRCGLGIDAPIHFTGLGDGHPFAAAAAMSAEQVSA